MTLTSASIVVCAFSNLLSYSLIFSNCCDSIKENLYGLLIQFLFICREMKINCYCDFIYNAGCELIKWRMVERAPSCSHWSLWAPGQVATLKILTLIRWEHGGRRLWALRPAFHVLERFGSSLTGKCSDGRDGASSHWSACAGAGEDEAGWARGG